MSILETGFVVGLLEKYAEPLVKKISQISVEEWEKFKVDFNLAFLSYSKNAYEKYSKIKTILYRTEPKYIYDFFETPMLQKGNERRFLAETVNDVIKLSHFILLRGSGGIGKSTLMKHLYLNSLEEKCIIPVFLELKEINDIEGTYQLDAILFEKLFNLGSTMKKHCMDYALESGCFLFLLDGYDELHSIKQEKFIKSLESFCDKFPENYFILSSRPCSEFIEFQRFVILSALPLSLSQATSLVKKIDFDPEIKDRFLKELQEKLYINFRSFASNPLLLNIMLLTFDNYAEIPEKLHLFYSNAFETLYSKHDATKAGYRREMKSKLSYDNFRNIFSCFCFITYSQGKYEFSHDELVSFLENAKKLSHASFVIDKYIFDLVSSLCVLYRDGLFYQFAHRSFQEYFSAVFLKELSDEQMKRVALQVIKKDTRRAIHDSVFKMLFDMAQQRFENNILLPLLVEIEQSAPCDLYDYYFEKLIPKVGFVFEENRPELVIYETKKKEMEDFIFTFVFFYANKTNEEKQRIELADNCLLQYLEENKEYEFNDGVDLKTMKDDDTMYQLLASSWIGERIKFLCTLKENIIQKQKEANLDLSCLVEM